MIQLRDKEYDDTASDLLQHDLVHLQLKLFIKGIEENLKKIMSSCLLYTGLLFIKWKP